MKNLILIISTLFLVSCHHPEQTSIQSGTRTVRQDSKIVSRTDSLVSRTDGQEQKTELLILFYESAHRADIHRAIRNMGGVVIYDYPNLNGMAVQAPHNCSIQQSLELLSGIDGVLMAKQDMAGHVD
ncbi:MAG: hypothetical protein IJ680_04610 [Paludibacteraceae bacterium]|nr:hypothetical protein [Paludibacteraceae bacterium]